MSDWVEAMLVERARAVPDLHQYAFEPKWDGCRALVRVSAGGVQIRSRHGTDLTSRFPELAALADVLRGTPALLDGELVCWGHDGAPDWSLVRNRIIRSRASAAAAAATAPATFVAFDLLYVDGRRLLTAPYAARRQELDDLALHGGAWRSTPTAVGPRAVAALHDAARDWRLEGLVAKRLDATYEPGRRSSAWLKLKWPWARDLRRDMRRFPRSG